MINKTAETSICPKCKSEKGMRTIFYGMPEEELDESIYSYGGCCLDELNPTKNCVKCGWLGDFVSTEKLMSLE